MKLSIHPDLKGKPDPHTRPDNSVYYTVNGKYVNQGYGWVNVECDWDQAYELITVDGYATSCELSSDNRCEANYISRQLVMVDIDDGMTIQELLNDDFYNEFGAGFYITKRHTDEHHRFRIMFVTEEPILDCQLMRKLIRGLLTVYKSGDTNCKDASRVYYGIPNCHIKENHGKVLSTDVIQALVEMIEQQDHIEAKQYVNTFEPTTVDETFVDELLSRINRKISNLRGEYDVWRTIAWATCHSVGINSAQSLLMKYWPDKTKKEIKTLKSWKQQHNGPTVGTLIKLSGVSSEERKLLEIQAKLRKIR